jgi:hypothetical protein
MGYEEQNMISDDTKSTLKKLLISILSLVLIPALFLCLVKECVWLVEILGLEPIR